MLTRELNDMKSKNKELSKKLKETEDEVISIQNAQASSSGAASDATKKLTEKLQKADAARREAEAEVADLKEMFEKHKRDSESAVPCDQAQAQTAQAELETLQIEFN